MRGSDCPGAVAVEYAAPIGGAVSVAPSTPLMVFSI